METFVPLDNTGQLFTSTAAIGDLYLVLPVAVSDTAITMSSAWSSATLGGTFVYSADGLDVTESSASQFIDAVLARVARAEVPRAFLWVTTIVAEAALMGLSPTGDAVVAALDAEVASGLRYTIGTGSTLTIERTTVHIGGGPIGYTDAHAPQPVTPVTTAQLDLDGDAVGTIAYVGAFTGASLLENASWGFQYAYGATAAWFPFAAAPTAPVTFKVRFDPSSPLNDAAGPLRSRMDFPLDKTPLATGLRTRQGLPVALIPAGDPGDEPPGLVFDRGLPPRSVVAAPIGDFVLSVDGGPDYADLLCGLQGTEIVTFRPLRQTVGDRMRFTPYSPGYASNYPFPVSSPVAAQGDPTAPLLDKAWTTSWATVLHAGGKVSYLAQPTGAALYSVGDAAYQSKGVLAWSDPAGALPFNLPFPIVGYGIAPIGWSAADAAAYERLIIAPARRAIVGAQSAPLSHRNPGLALPDAFTATTAAGRIVAVTPGGWTSITLGRTTDPQLALCFTKPSASLQQAFGSASLFLVAANGYYLGAQHEGDGKIEDVPTFNNTVDIGGWRLAARVGVGNEYADYRNVMIVKGRRGKLYDATNPGQGLVANPDSWTQPDFAIPTEPDRHGDFTTRQRRELVILSQWLQDYFRAALTGGADYTRFNAIAADPNWTGTLFLRVDVTGLPHDLLGIMAGVTDPGGFTAHHLGVEGTPVSGSGSTDPTTTAASSLFGLIDYTDPAFTRPIGAMAARPVRPAPATTYDFRLLSLQVSFANTAVRRFASWAQLTASSWFDMPVDHMGESGNRFSALLLTGTLQTNNGLPVYTMASSDDASYYFTNDVVRKIEITGAAMSTRSLGDELDPLAGSWFSLAGFLDFDILHAREPDEHGAPVMLDMFSFGSDPGTDQARHGLAFTNLGILMSYPPDDPSSCVFTFEAGEIQFDIATSTPREGSLFRQFALDVTGLATGALLTPPRRNGYLDVATDARLDGLGRGPWWGIDYQLSLGSAGHLAAQASLTGQLLTAWSPRTARTRARPNNEDSAGERSYAAAIGLKLPGTGGGAKLISLQSVLRLSIGSLHLRYDPTEHAFMLLLSEIALRVLGLGTLPPGSTLAYLYGDPHGAGAPSGLGWYAMYQREEIGR